MADGSAESGAKGSEGRLPERPPTTQEAVVHALRESMASGDLRPGDRLYQDAIAEQMGVSRVPVREALNVLRADGQVEYSPHRGYWVAALTRESLEEIKLIRGLLEGEAIRLAFPKVDDALLETMAELNESMAESHDADDVPRFARLNREFHFALFDRAGLPRLVRHIEMLWKSVDIYREPIFTENAIRGSMLSEHVELIDACRRGDVAAALEVMDRHRAKAVSTLTGLVVDDESPQTTPDVMPDETADHVG